jgi:hypothetical protein
MLKDVNIIFIIAFLGNSADHSIQKNIRRRKGILEYNCAAFQALL